MSMSPTFVEVDGKAARVGLPQEKAFVMCILRMIGATRAVQPTLQRAITDDHARHHIHRPTVPTL